MPSCAIVRLDPVRSPESPLAGASASAGDPDKKIASVALFFSIAVFFFIMAAAVASSLALFGDGSNYLVKTASAGTIYNEETPGSPRISAHVLTESLLLLGLKLGIHDFPTLGVIYSLNQYLIPLASLVVCLLILRDKRYVIFPVLSYLFATLQVYSFIVCEAHDIVALFWPILFIILEWEHLTTGKAVLLVVLGLFALDCYESVLFFSSLALALLAFQVFRSGGRAKLYAGLVALVLGAGVFIAVKSAFAAHGSGNEHTLFHSYKYLVKLDLHFYVLTFLLAVFCCTQQFRWTSRAVWISALCAFAVPLLCFMARPHLLRIEDNYNFRLLLVFVPLGLGLLAIAVKLGRWESWLESAWLWRAVIVMSAYTLALETGITYQWYGYQQYFRSYLQSTPARGLSDAAGTPLFQDHDGPQLLYALGWMWTYPDLSIISSHEGKVNTLLYARSNSPFPFPLDKPPAFRQEFPVRYVYLDHIVGGLPSELPGESSETQQVVSDAGRDPHSNDASQR